MNTIKLTVKTHSNLFIGGAPTSFDIGGIDLYTVTDENRRPYIPASSLKGALRSIVRGDTSENSKAIKELYRAYLERHNSSDEENTRRNRNIKIDQEQKEKMLKNYKDALCNLSAEYLFGIKGFNNTPKLFFSDLKLCDDSRNEKEYFSIDYKNAIEINEDKPVSNPRIYKSVRSGLCFTGEIQLYRIELLGEEAPDICRELLIDNLNKFNHGIYRLGNSKSRGYGKIEVTISDESEGTVDENQ